MVCYCHESDTNWEAKQQLKKRMLGSPLCDGSSFASDIEKAYAKMWQTCLK